MQTTVFLYPMALKLQAGNIFNQLIRASLSKTATNMHIPPQRVGLHVTARNPHSVKKDDDGVCDGIAFSSKHIHSLSPKRTHEQLVAARWRQRVAAAVSQLQGL